MDFNGRGGGRYGSFVGLVIRFAFREAGFRDVRGGLAAGGCCFGDGEARFALRFHGFPGCEWGFVLVDLGFGLGNGDFQPVSGRFRWCDGCFRWCYAGFGWWGWWLSGKNGGLGWCRGFFLWWRPGFGEWISVSLLEFASF